MKPITLMQLPPARNVGVAPDSTCGKGRESSVLDVNAGNIQCTNNQYN